MFNSAEIKIVRTNAKIPMEEFSHWVIRFYDQTTSLTCDMKLSTTKTLWIGSNTLPDSDTPCSTSIGGQTGNAESFGETIR